jgi:hypothetical protein
MLTKEKPIKTVRRNPVDTSGYQNTDARDEQRKEREQSQRFVCFFGTKETAAFGQRDAGGQLEMYVRALTRASAEKPRWKKIIEHANSLADERGMSREQFYSTALIEFIEKIENLRITEELNEVYKDIDQQEENALLNRLVSHYDPRLADE